MKFYRLIALLSILASSCSSPEKNPDTEVPPINAPKYFLADELAMQYANNETAADSIYIDSVFTIMGSIISSMDANDGTFSIDLAGMPNYAIQCVMREDSKEYAKTIKLNSIVAVQGRCVGYNGAVVLEEAKIIELIEAPAPLGS